MKKLYYSLWLFICIAPIKALATVEFHEDKPHHLSVLIGGTHVDEEHENLFTLGIDYEYRINTLLGFGTVIEQTFGNIEATTILAVADIHVWHGLIFQVGPGVEFVHDEIYKIGRFGILYEFEWENGFTLSPQLHYDLSSAEDTLVFGIAIGKSF